MKKIKDGFTLLELMIVVAIIGILATVLFPAIAPEPEFDEQVIEPDVTFEEIADQYGKDNEF